MTKKDFHEREAAGTFRASRFIRDFAKKKRPISLELIYKIHKLIWEDAWPEIAGKLRTEELKKQWHSFHLSPHPSQIFQLMRDLSIEFQEKLKELSPIRIVDPDDEKSVDTVNKVIEVAAWIHHRIVWIHPFRDGNGRVARLMANLILERYGLIPGLSSRTERDNRNAYIEALKQADEVGDYQLLIDFITEGIIERFVESPHRTYLE